MPPTVTWGRLAACAVALAAVASGCDASTSGAPEPDAGAEGDSGANRVECPSPSAPPADGARCAVPEGTTCAFGGCGSRLAVCRGARWVYGANPPPNPPCPADPPAPATTCPPCWPAAKTCTYFAERCFSGAVDAAAPQNVAVASCYGITERTWNVAIHPCSPQDAGADVQRDVAPDAD